MSRNMAPFLHPKESLRKEVPSGCIADSKYSDSVCLVMSAGGTSYIKGKEQGGQEALELFLRLLPRGL